ncbi:MAG: TIGR02710 family CRISPR-associated protein [Deltaproteobacteria bacterium]|nr:MAG: TIGR02710 family CRISPR-associated protein [Deltaproteobacteria bacterium]
MSILILTVGGSCEPLVNAISKEDPEFVYFVCSSGSKGSQRAVDGQGKPCKEYMEGKETSKPSIVEQTELEKELYEKWELSDPDSLAHCYERLLELAKEIRKRFGAKNPRIIANYTGGTKTMSVALALVAMIEEDWELQLNKGPRTDLVKVRGGDVPILINKWEVFANHVLTSIKESLCRYDYSGAAELAYAALRHPLSEERQAQFQRIYALSKGFEAWDRFDHKEAYILITPFAKDFVDHKIALESFLGKRRKPSGYELVGDLIRNAERRAVQGRYDDAVARLYRALELFAQIRLKDVLGIEWSPTSSSKDREEKTALQLSLEHIPEALRVKYKDKLEKGMLKLGLFQDFELLADLKDPVADYFKQKEKTLREALKKRNYSILAHGLIPLNQREYKEVYNHVVGFIKESAQRLKIDIDIPQLPMDFCE